MSETTEDIAAGIVCQVCGQWMPECFTGQELNRDFFDNPPGYPRTCKDCKKDISQKGEPWKNQQR